MTRRVILCVEKTVAIDAWQALCRDASAQLDTDILPKVRGGDWRGADSKVWRFVDPVVEEPELTEAAIGTPQDQGSLSKIPYWTNLLGSLRSGFGFVGLLHHFYSGEYASEIVVVRTVIRVSDLTEMEEGLRRLDRDTLLST